MLARGSVCDGHRSLTQSKSAIFHIDLYRGTQRPLVSDQDFFSRNPNPLFLLLPALTSLYL